MPRHRVLIVEDEHDIAGLIKHTLERTGEAGSAGQSSETPYPIEHEPHVGRAKRHLGELIGDRAVRTGPGRVPCRAA